MHELFVPVEISFVSDGCQVSAASSPYQSPSRAMYALAAPPSSPGQPKNMTVPGFPLAARYSFTAAAAASEPAPSRLWPQP